MEKQVAARWRCADRHTETDAGVVESDVLIGVVRREMVLGYQGDMLRGIADRHTETDAGVVESDVLIADGATGIQRGRSAQVQRCMRV